MGANPSFQAPDTLASVRRRFGAARVGLLQDWAGRANTWHPGMLWVDLDASSPRPNS